MSIDEGKASVLKTWRFDQERSVVAFIRTMLAVILSSIWIPLAANALPLLPGSAELSMGDKTRLFGMPVDVRILDIPHPIPDAARLLAERYAFLHETGVSSAGLVLSGNSADVLWTVLLQPVGETRTSAIVSRFSDRSAGSDHSANEGPFPVAHDMYRAPEWLPSGARLRLEFEQMLAATEGMVMHQIWTTDLPIASTVRFMNKELVRLGWRADGAVPNAVSGTSLWSGPKGWMQITVTPAGNGSGILLLRQPGDLS